MSEFKEFIENKRVWYQNIGKVFCPILGEDVIFNAKGFYHLRYDGKGKIRTNKEQTYRMNTLGAAKNVIENAGEVLDYQVRYSRSKNKNVEYWELGRTISNEKITVILRKEGGGQLTFYSTWRKGRKSKNPPQEVL